VIEHLIAQLEQRRSPGIMAALMGSGPMLSTRDLARVAHETAKPFLVKGASRDEKAGAAELLQDLYDSGPEGKQEVIAALDRWADVLRARNRDSDANEIEAVKANIEIPF
jgi:hypothetical protein